MPQPTSAREPALELLFEQSNLPRFGLSELLRAAYAGDFGVLPTCTYANFVSSLDGVVGLPGAEESGRIVSGGSDADRFVMGLLRACADAVLIGAGTFRRAPGAFWHAADIYPTLAGEFAALRHKLGLMPEPLLVLVTASGELDAAQPALEGALIATTHAGKAKLSGALPASARTVAFDADTVPLSALLELLRAEGRRRVLTEGGPSLVGDLLAQDLLNELFLTTSPRLFGRTPNDGKKSLVDGVELAGRALSLASVRRAGSHLFLRYGLAK